MHYFCINFFLKSEELHRPTHTLPLLIAKFCSANGKACFLLDHPACVLYLSDTEALFHKVV